MRLNKFHLNTCIMSYDCIIFLVKCLSVKHNTRISMTIYYTCIIDSHLNTCIIILIHVFK